MTPPPALSPTLSANGRLAPLAHTPDGKWLDVDVDYLLATLQSLLKIPSPTGYTDNISRWVGKELGRLGIDFTLTRRGAIDAHLPGTPRTPRTPRAPHRAVVGHLDTLGAMVTELKENGRLSCTPIGTWSSRFAEGARVTVFTDTGHQRGTLMPLKASGHVYNEEIDTQPISWENVEIRIDDRSRDVSELMAAGFRVGDFVAIDPQPEFLDNGYVVSRHLDNKAGVACMLAAAKLVVDRQLTPPMDTHLVFTLFEEVGTGASGVLHEEISELIGVDNATNAPRQNSSEYGATVAIKDSSGPFDYHLTRKLLSLARDGALPHGRDVFKHYRSDAASAVEAGADIRTALLCFGVDGSHGYERTHVESLRAVSALIALYMQSDPAVARDVKPQATGLEGFPTQHSAAFPITKKRSPDAAGEHQKRP